MNNKKYNNCLKQERCDDCDSNDICNEWTDFIIKEQNNKSLKKYGAKPYSHFDKRVSLLMYNVRKYVINPENIIKHGFYPLIHFRKRNSRYGKKKKLKFRDLYYCSHLDRCVYQRYAFLINYKYNIWAKNYGLDDNAIAYRNNNGKSNIEFAKDAFSAVSKFENSFVFVGDFTNFFDEIQHSYLKKMLCRVLGVEILPKDYFAVFKNITRFSSWDWEKIIKATGEHNKRGVISQLNSRKILLTKDEFKKNKNDICKNTSGRGIPQGTPISAVLSNVYMIEYDQRIKEYVEQNNGIYMRYSDDFIIVLPFNNIETIEVYKESILSFIDSMDDLVNLQTEKTSCYIHKDRKVYSYPDNKLSQIDYLGFVFDGEKIRIRPRSITKYYYRMRRKAHNIVKSNWISSKGKHITAKRLYAIYSKNGKGQTFISYAIRARRIIKLNDSETNALIERHKQKISLALKGK